jgi:hypothetical protein
MGHGVEMLELGSGLSANLIISGRESKLTQTLSLDMRIFSFAGQSSKSLATQKSLLGYLHAIVARSIMKDFGNFRALVEQTIDLQQAELRQKEVGTGHNQRGESEILAFYYTVCFKLSN